MSDNEVGFGGTINDFDELTNFVCGEDEKYIVEYILCDEGGFNHRCSPFLMPVGTIFEHEFGVYTVLDITRKNKHIQVFCDRTEYNKHPNFDKLHSFDTQKN